MLKQIIYLLVLIPFSGNLLTQEYTYLLSVTSKEVNEQKFNLEVKSTQDTDSKETIRVLNNQETPFEMELESGTYEIIVYAIEEDSHIESRVTSVLGGIPVGNASCDEKRALLEVGPRGQWKASGI